MKGKLIIVLDLGIKKPSGGHLRKRKSSQIWLHTARTVINLPLINLPFSQA